MTTPKELAEALAVAALEVLKALLDEEPRLRERLRETIARGPGWSSDITNAHDALQAAMKRTDFAFEAWRAASEAVP